MNHPSKVLAPVALGLGIGTLILNPRVNITDEAAVLISCTTSQIILVNRSEPVKDELRISNGIYTAETIVETLYEQMASDMKESLAGKPFAGFAYGLLQSIRPTIEKAMNNAIDNSCAFKEATFALQDLMPE